MLDLVISMSRAAVTDNLLADILSVSKRTVDSWKVAGKIKPLKNGTYSLKKLSHFPQIKAMLESK
ncbi:MAG: hypothetical protein Q9O24_07330 [Gammaproteobacteria bacterium]|nr:hypothetical protein [Gammaproteobacteria bacterium]